MPSRTYDLFADAMASRRPIACIYHGHPRALCPIILGYTDGAEKALTWQFEGSGSRGPVRGQWKCLSLAEVSNAETIEGPWRSGRRHSQAQSCVKDVDLDVNPDSPYDPKRRVPTLRAVK
ncbi:MAG: hypothetical protein M3Y78_06795 [Pseudomonadota bacterium]|nr:hypothetical protein [Pseudomonadota bacterium]